MNNEENVVRIKLKTIKTSDDKVTCQKQQLIVDLYAQTNTQSSVTSLV